MIYDVNGKKLDSVDYTKGYVSRRTMVKKDAVPVDNIKKFAWLDSDYETIDVFVEYTPEQLQERQAATPDDDRDEMLVEIFYQMLQPIANNAQVNAVSNNSVLYRTLKRLSHKKTGDSFKEKIDMFYRASKLTEAEYNDLISKYQKGGE